MTHPLLKNAYQRDIFSQIEAEMFQESPPQKSANAAAGDMAESVANRWTLMVAHLMAQWSEKDGQK